MSATAEGVAELRPVSIRKLDGRWTVVDLGGLLGMHSIFGWVVTPFRPTCCWFTARAVADTLARRYRSQPLPAWAAAHAPPPGCTCDRDDEGSSR